MNAQVDVFPSLILLAPADHPQSAEQLNPSTPTEDAVYFDTTRVVVMNDWIFVAKDLPEGPVVAFQEKIRPETLNSNREGGNVVTVSGSKISWRKDASCGCGSRLRTWRPYKHAMSVMDPGPTS